MPEETITAAPSAAEEDVFRGESPTAAEYNHWRQTGEVPERFKPAEAVDVPEKTASEGEEPESAAEPEAAKEDTQEQPQKPKKLNAEGRIAQIAAQIEKLWEADEPDTIKIAQLEATREKIEQRAGLKRKTAPAPVAQPQAQPQQQYTRPKPTADDKDQNGNPKYQSYEDYVEDLADWKAEQRIVQREREQAIQQQQERVRARVEAARGRYENFDELFWPTLSAVVSDPQIPLSVKEMLDDSDVLPDLLFTLGSDEAALSRFLQVAKQSPTKAARYIAELERGISEELSAETARNEKGQFAPKTEAPAKPKTAAPPPPSPVGGTSARAFDPSDESLSPEQWAAKRNAELARRR